MNRIITACLISLFCGCGKNKPQFATDEEYKGKNWYSCAVAVRDINGVKFICWSDFDCIYYSNTVNGVVSRKKAR